MKRLNFKPLQLAFICIVSVSIYGHAQQGNVTINQDQKITELLELKKEMNKNASDRYKIQIYSGGRNEAYKVQKEFDESFTNWKSIDAFEEPNFKIWVGSFRNRLEADRALKEIKQKYPNAFVFQPKK